MPGARGISIRRGPEHVAIRLHLVGRQEQLEVRFAGGTIGLRTAGPQRTSLLTEPPRWLMPCNALFFTANPARRLVCPPELGSVQA